MLAIPTTFFPQACNSRYFLVLENGLPSSSPLTQKPEHSPPFFLSQHSYQIGHQVLTISQVLALLFTHYHHLDKWSSFQSLQIQPIPTGDQNVLLKSEI